MTHHHTLAALVTSRAGITTGTPGRYAKQLVSHLGRKLEFSTEGSISPATLGEATVQITTDDGVLRMVAASHDEAADARVEEVLGSHLERFGQPNELTVTWTRSESVVSGSRP